MRGHLRGRCRARPPLAPSGCCSDGYGLPPRAEAFAGNDVYELGFGVDSIEHLGFDERVDCGSVLLASVGCCQQPIFTTYGEATDRALGDIAVDLECAVFEIGRQSGEPRQRMANVDGRAAQHSQKEPH